MQLRARESGEHGCRLQARIANLHFPPGAKFAHPLFCSQHSQPFRQIIITAPAPAATALTHQPCSSMPEPRLEYHDHHQHLFLSSPTSHISSLPSHSPHPIPRNFDPHGISKLQMKDAIEKSLQALEFDVYHNYGTESERQSLPLPLLVCAGDVNLSADDGIQVLNSLRCQGGCVSWSQAHSPPPE